MKLKHFIATHTFHSDKVKKEYLKFVKHRKKNADWFENVPKRENAQLHQLFIGKADFFFCHWYAESEQVIIDKLASIGADDLFITMAVKTKKPIADTDELEKMRNQLLQQEK